VQLAENIHTVQSTISDWENGIREPNTKFAIILADYFGVTIDEVLGISLEPPDSDEIDQQKEQIEQNNIENISFTQTEMQLLKKFIKQLQKPEVADKLGFQINDGEE
jgi:transcriptional regulator with XRE-family HTH domain